MRGSLCALGVVVLVLALGAMAPAARAAGPALTIVPVNPVPGGSVYTQTPQISVYFSDSAGAVDPTKVLMYVDSLNVTALDTTTITPKGINCTIPALLKLSYGNHTVSVSAVDTLGNRNALSWGFNVSTGGGAVHPIVTINPTTLLFYIALGASLAAAGFGGFIFYLKQTRRFTFKKYFTLHPVRRGYLVLLIPGLLAFAFVLVALIVTYNSPSYPPNTPDYIVVVGIFIGLTAFAIDARREKQRMRAFERAFAQFLFELADAMRGGLDPAKSIIELSKTTTNILRKPMRVAADNLRLGRSLDEVLKSIAAPMRSPLISRYANLVAEGAAVGGETASVVYRAAKDMDDFIKIEVERVKQLVMPVAVLYIAFAVLMAVLFSLLFIAPSLGTINVSILTRGNFQLGAGGAAASTTTAAKIPPSVLRERFFDLMAINALGTGVIIGAFTEGKAQYGLLHSLALLAGTTFAFAILFPT